MALALQMLCRCLGLQSRCLADKRQPCVSRSGGGHAQGTPAEPAVMSPSVSEIARRINQLLWLTSTKGIVT